LGVSLHFKSHNGEIWHDDADLRLKAIYPLGADL